MSDHTIEALFETLLKPVKAALRESKPTVMQQRVEAPLTLDVDPLVWLAAQDQCAQYYWGDRSGDFTMAGAGEADVVIPSGPVDFKGLFKYIRRRLPDAMPSLRYYGGFRFHHGSVDGTRWASFKSFRFVVPRLEIVRRGSGMVVACNFKVGPARQNVHEWDAVQEAIHGLTPLDQATEAPFPGVRSRRDAPDRMAWEAMINEALDAIASHDLEKVVLARETIFKGDCPWPPVAVLQRLVNQTRRSFDFCFHPSPGRAFLGASPERLYKRSNCFLQSEALAGTRARGRTNDEDRRLSEELLDSEKDLREHRFVVRMLREQCSRFCSHVEVAEKPRIMRLRDVQHLHTTLEGVLTDPEVDAQLIQALHPTPAVGGVPREKALKWIADHEPFDRGIFAAPVGWVGYDGAEFCVAIRSALIQHQELSAYAGAGIVPGSEAQSEWEEIENKLGAIRHAIK